MRLYDEYGKEYEAKVGNPIVINSKVNKKVMGTLLLVLVGNFNSCRHFSFFHTHNKLV